MEKSQEAHDQIQKMVTDSPILLFMKGKPETPLCGFSARVVQILAHLKVEYDAFDVLSDESIRQGIKTFSQWPTIPQLYVKGQLLGGCDIIQDKFLSGELEKDLQQAQS